MGLFSRSKNSSSSVYSRNQLSLLESPYGVYFPIETLEFFLYDFKFKFGMNARPIRPHKMKEMPNTFGLMQLVSVAYLNTSLAIFS